MENPFHETEQLFRYLDGEMSGEEKRAFEQQLANDPALRKRADEQRLLEGNLKSIKLEEPSSSFAQQVMTRISQAPQGQAFSIRNSILLLAGVIVVSLIATYLVRVGLFDATAALDAPKELGVLSKYIKEPLPSIPVNGKLIVNGIILINLALAFVILDRAVLRPYFERRMRHS